MTMIGSPTNVQHRSQNPSKMIVVGNIQQMLDDLKPQPPDNAAGTGLVTVPPSIPLPRDIPATLTFVVDKPDESSTSEDSPPPITLVYEGDRTKGWTPIAAQVSGGFLLMGTFGALLAAVGITDGLATPLGIVTLAAGIVGFPVSSVIFGIGLYNLVNVVKRT